jgi:Flp pilus assembly pilin Flp
MNSGVAMSKHQSIQHFFSDDAGATAVEYAMIAGAMTIMLVPSMLFLSTSVRENLYDVIIALFG